MEEQEKLLIACDWVRKLANGINPLNGNAVKEDDIVNNVHVSRCLFYVADILGRYSVKKPKSNRNAPFDLSALQIEKYNYMDAISISVFAREIQKLLPETMQSVSYNAMSKWLIQQGLLQESSPDSEGHTYKIATPKGNSIGIYSEERENNGRHYMGTLYNIQAQKFLIEHLEEISRIQ